MKRGDAVATCSWVTNVPAPYRRPLWSAVGRRLRLTVYLLESDRHMRLAGRRGADWAASDGEHYRVAHLRVVPISGGPDARFVAIEPVGLRTTRAESVLLGGWDSPLYWQILLTARVRRRRVVAFYESTLATNHFRRGPVALARSRFFRAVDAVVVPGPAAAAAVRSFGVPEARIHVGFNAVDVVGFNTGARAARGNREVPANRFVFVGQLIDRKNVDGLLHAFAQLGDPAARLLVVGQGGLRDGLEAIAESLGISAQVTFTAFVANEELPTTLAEYSTLVLPSLEEVWGLVVNEALAAGLQVVVTQACGVAASVDGMQGVFITPPTADGLSRGMAQSAAMWRGPIERPAILDYTPERFADVFVSALAG